MSGVRTWETPFFPDEPLPVVYTFPDPDLDELAEWAGTDKVRWEVFGLDNRLNPRLNPNTLPQPEVIDRRWDATDRHVCTIFVPTALLTRMMSKSPPTTFPLTVLYGAGNEELGYGLRYYFQRAGTSALMCVAGRESGTPGGRWNVGVTQADIEEVFKSWGYTSKPEVQVLAGYSTGYGVVQTINNDLVPLDKVKRLVFFDCIYRCDKPPLPPSAPRPVLLAGDLPEFGSAPPGQVLLDEKKEGFFQKPFNTRRAIARLTAASPKCLVAGYSTTESGSPRYALWKSATDGKPLTRGSRPVVELPVLAELRDDKVPRGLTCSPSQAFDILILCRFLDLGVGAGLVAAKDVPASYRKIIDAGLPPRGSVFSSDAVKAVAALPAGLSAGIDLLAWANAIPVKPTAFERTAAAKLVREHMLVLPKWDYDINSDLDEFRHGGVLMEFGWELLPP